MTITSTATRIEYVGDGATVDFPIPWKFFDNDDFQVWVNEALETSYSVTGQGEEAGGTMTFTAAPGNGHLVIILGSPANEQVLDLIEGGPLPADSIEEGLDRTVVLIKKHEEKLNRAFTFPVTSQSEFATIPDIEAGKLLMGISATETAWVSGDDLGAIIVTGEPALTGYAYASLPDPVALGRMAYLTDRTRSIVLKKSFGWVENDGAIYDVKNFGALGDGATNDQAACQAAIDAALGSANGGVVYFPPGDYRFPATGLTITNTDPSIPLWICGAGYSSRLHYTGSGEDFITGSNTGHFRMSNLRISGAASRMILLTGYGASAPQGEIHLEHLDVSGSTVKDTTPLGPAAGIWLNAVSDAWIEHCHVHGNGYATADVAISYDILVNASGLGSRIHIHNNHVVGQDSHGGIVVYQSDNTEIHDNDVDQGNHYTGLDTGYGIAVYSNVKRASICGNRVTNCAGSGIYYNGTAGGGGIIANNRVLNSCQQQSSGSIPVAGIAVNTAAGLTDPMTIMGNVVQVSAQFGISFQGRCAVIGNEIADIVKTGIEIRNGGAVSCDFSTIIGNSVVNASTTATHAGIKQSSASDTIRQVVIEGNTVKLSALTGHGIHLINAQRCTINSNNVVGQNSGAFVGIILASSFMNTIVGNDVRLFGTSYQDSSGGGNNTCRNNNFSNFVGGVSATLYHATTSRSGNRFSTTGDMQGLATLVAGTVTVSTIEAFTGDRIALTRHTAGGTLGHLSAPAALSSGTNFRIDSSSALDTSIVFWEIVH